MDAVTWNKGLATVAAAAMCMYWAHLNDGSSGIGWFILCLILIW